jgi:hypothetical protein
MWQFAFCRFLLSENQSQMALITPPPKKNRTDLPIAQQKCHSSQLCVAQHTYKRAKFKQF